MQPIGALEPGGKLASRCQTPSRVHGASMSVRVLGPLIALCSRSSPTIHFRTPLPQPFRQVQGVGIVQTQRFPSKMDFTGVPVPSPSAPSASTDGSLSEPMIFAQLPPSSSPRPKSVDPRGQLLGWFNDGVQKRPAFATAATPASGPTWPSRFRRVPFCPSPYGAIQPAACMGCAFCASARALKCTVLFMVSTMACNVVRLARVQCACTSQAT